MKKADNFDATKWLVENKITTQSKLNEFLDFDKVKQLGKKAIEDYISSNNLGTISSIISLGARIDSEEYTHRFEVILAPTGKTLDITVQYDANYNLTDIKVNTPKSKSTNSDEKFIEVEYPSGDYSGEIENGKVEFLLIDDSIEDKYEEGFNALDDEQIMKYLGKNHFFTKLYKTIGGTFNMESDAVGITVDLNDLKSKFKKYIVDIS
jgi:hypothetical protein